MRAPSCAAAFDGIERADSFIVDPHKWLFAPFDCCALLYRDPAAGARGAHAEGRLPRRAHRLREWNPSDYAFHLTRRARGLPFWFSLAAHGTEAYTEAIERTLAVARRGRRGDPPRATYVELLHEPELSVVVFRRIGWTPAQYADWSDRLMRANFAFVRRPCTTARPSRGSRS